MMDLSEGSQLPATDGPGPPLVHFVPMDGERLEHLASAGRRPMRWAASVVLSLQARRPDHARRRRHATTESGAPEPLATTQAGAPEPLATTQAGAPEPLATDDG